MSLPYPLDCLLRRARSLPATIPRALPAPCQDRRNFRYCDIHRNRGQTCSESACNINAFGFYRMSHKMIYGKSSTATGWNTWIFPSGDPPGTFVNDLRSTAAGGIAPRIGNFLGKLCGGLAIGRVCGCFRGFLMGLVFGRMIGVLSDGRFASLTVASAKSPPLLPIGREERRLDCRQACGVSSFWTLYQWR